MIECLFLQVGISPEEAEEDLEALWNTDPELERAEHGFMRLREASKELELEPEEDDDDDDESLSDLEEEQDAPSESARAFVPFGPPAILVAGFREHELGMVSLSQTVLSACLPNC